MAEPLHSQVDTYLHRLDHLIGDGRRLRDALQLDPTNSRELELMGRWQRECAATISQLSGGSKAHWLSRSYSDAFLLSAQPGRVATEATVQEIIERILGVLHQAKVSLTQADPEALATASQGTQAPASRFDFVRDPALRPDLERAHADGHAAFARSDFTLALVTFASILETIITDALNAAPGAATDGPAAAACSDSSFDDRITTAEQMGRISAGCARLPRSAREYKSLLDQQGDLLRSAEIPERDARLTLQVLNVIMRDLAPGR